MMLVNWRIYASLGLNELTWNVKYDKSIYQYFLLFIALLR